MLFSFLDKLNLNNLQFSCSKFITNLIILYHIITIYFSVIFIKFDNLIYERGKRKYIHNFDDILQREDKESLLKQRSIVIWMTGLSGSGKTTV